MRARKNVLSFFLRFFAIFCVLFVCFIVPFETMHEEGLDVLGSDCLNDWDNQVPQQITIVL